MRHFNSNQIFRVFCVNGKRLRNSSFFKKLPSNIPVLPVPSDDEERTTPMTETAEAVKSHAGLVEPLEAVESGEPPPLRRSGRTRREPEYLKDYIT